MFLPSTLTLWLIAGAGAVLVAAAALALTLSEKLRRWCLRVITAETARYIIVGGCTTLVNLLAYTFCNELLSLEVNLSNVISVIAAILFAYVTNKLFVFRSRCQNNGALLLEFVKFVGARLLTMGIEVGGVFVLYSLIGQNEYLAKIETQIIVLISNYLISKFLVFTDKKEQQ